MRVIQYGCNITRKQRNNVKLKIDANLVHSLVYKRVINLFIKTVKTNNNED